MPVANAFQLEAQGVSIPAILFGNALPVLIPLLVGIFMLSFPGMATNVLVGGDAITPAPSSAVREVERAAYALLGTYLVVISIADGFFHYSKFRLYQSVIENRGYFEMPKLLPQDFGAIMATAAQFILGLVLIFGATGFARLFRRLRGEQD
jgi:hypothetical protein